MLTRYGNGVDRAQSYFNGAPGGESGFSAETGDKPRLSARFQAQLFAKTERQFDSDTNSTRLDVFPRLLIERPVGGNQFRFHAELGLSSARIAKKEGGVFDSRPGRANLWLSRALLEFRAPRADENVLILEAGLDLLPEGINIPLGSNPARNFDLVFEESLYSQARFTLTGNRYLTQFYVFGPSIDTPETIQRKGVGVLSEYYALEGSMTLGTQFRGSFVSDSTKLSYGPFLRLGWKNRWAFLAEAGGISWNSLAPPESTLVGNDTHEFRSTLSLYYHFREWLVASLGHSTGYNLELDSRRPSQIFGGIGARVSPHFSIGLFARRDSFAASREPRVTVGINTSAKY